MTNIKHTFDGSFENSFNEKSVPEELLIFVKLLVSGNSNELETGFSLPVNTISQLILYNFNRKCRINSTGQTRYLSSKESPFLLYIGLKLYTHTRSRQIIEILLKHGLCVTYDRILWVTQGLSEASLSLFENDDAVVPGNLRCGLFTIGAKDNIDKNSSCTVSKFHYHGTSLSLFQFPTYNNPGIERHYEKYVKIPSSMSKKVRELPTFYTEYKEINDLPDTVFAAVPTVTIPLEMTDFNDILTVGRDKEFRWLQYVSDATETNSDLSWSVYNERRNDPINSEKSYNSILPLLRQNVRSYSMQMHCIEITKAAIEILNPGQPAVDVSDQPIYAISKHLQLIYPDQYGLHKYLPMFGGLHIEKLLLELHGQIIAGNGLPEILNISKLSMTGAGNTLVNVSAITSARYVLQVCAAAEYKVLKLMYDDDHSLCSFNRLPPVSGRIGIIIPVMYPSINQSKRQ